MSGVVANEISDSCEKSEEQVESIVSGTSQTMKAFVKESSFYVEEGERLADQCTKVLDVVVTHTTDVKRKMDTIATASAEQADGIQNINSAMNELDSQTQVQANIADNTSRMVDVLKLQSVETRKTLRDLVEQILGKDGISEGADIDASDSQENSLQGGELSPKVSCRKYECID